MEKKYLKNQLEVILPRVLSNLCRDPLNSDYGCFDRRYWAWHTTIMPDISLQRQVIILAYFWQDKNSHFYHDKELLSWIVAAIHYWQAKCHLDGSMDQAFPEEHSWAATGFTLNSIIDTLNIIGRYIDKKNYTDILMAISKSAQFIAENKETHGIICNHILGCSLALIKTGKICKNKRYHISGLNLLHYAFNYYHKEGWFEEYNGADAGYQTLALYYLSEIAKHNKLIPKYQKGFFDAIYFVSHFLYPDGSFSIIGQRRTAVLYPAVLFCRGYLNKIKKLPIELSGIDDGNLAPLAETIIYCLNNKKYPSSQDRFSNGIHIFYIAGIAIINTPRQYGAFNLKLGGIGVVFDKKTNKRIYEDGGLMFIKDDNKYSTQGPSHFLFKKNTIQIKGHFYSVPMSTFTTNKLLIGQLLGNYLFKISFLRELFKRKLIRSINTTHPLIPFERTIIIHCGNIAVEDNYEIIHRTIKILPVDATPIHMASARYYYEK